MSAILSQPQRFNPLYAGLFEETQKLYKYFLLFLNNKMSQVVKIHPHGKPVAIYHTESIPWLLMTCWYWSQGIRIHGNDVFLAGYSGLTPEASTSEGGFFHTEICEYSYGEVMEVWLSCCLVLLSFDSKTRHTGTHPGTHIHRFDEHVKTLYHNLRIFMHTS